MDELKKNGTNPPNDTEPINGELTDELQKKLKELDKESNTVEYSGIFGKIIAAICICFSLFQIYTGIFGTLDPEMYPLVVRSLPGVPALPDKEGMDQRREIPLA